MQRKLALELIRLFMFSICLLIYWKTKSSSRWIIESSSRSPFCRALQLAYVPVNPPITNVSAHPTRATNQVRRNALLSAYEKSAVWLQAVGEDLCAEDLNRTGR